MLARHNDGLLPHMLPNLLCFRHPFCAEEETLHQKQNRRILQKSIKNPCYVDSMFPHGYAALPYEAFTDRPTCCTPAPSRLCHSSGCIISLYSFRKTEATNVWRKSSFRFFFLLFLISGDVGKPARTLAGQVLPSL